MRRLQLLFSYPSCFSVWLIYLFYRYHSISDDTHMSTIIMFILDFISVQGFGRKINFLGFYSNMQNKSFHIGSW